MPALVEPLPLQAPTVSREVLTHLADVLGRLCEVLALPDEYDRDYLPPSAEAVAAASLLLVESATLATKSWPKGRLGVIGDGGLGIEWHSGGGVVNLVVPPKPDLSYVFYEVAGQRSTVPATPSSLTEALNRLIGS